jgi:hypothetical protein
MQRTDTRPGGGLARLEYDQLEPQLARYLAARVQRLGYLGEFFKCMGHQPQALLAFMQFTESLKQGLPPNLTEVVALTVAGWSSNAYERNQHERLCVKLGFGRDWVAAVNALAPHEAMKLSAIERQVQAFTLAVLKTRGHGMRERFEQEILRELGPAASVAILMAIGRYLVHSTIVNTLELSPPVPSIFEDGFGQ